jgi:hypothetical protein
LIGSSAEYYRSRNRCSVLPPGNPVREQ